jgi:hypothetical protein
MAEIHLTAMTEEGPVMPTRHSAFLKDKIWLGGGTVKELVLLIGKDTVKIWPADEDEIEALGNRLLEIAKELREG